VTVGVQWEYSGTGLAEQGSRTNELLPAKCPASGCCKIVFERPVFLSVFRLRIKFQCVSFPVRKVGTLKKHILAKSVHLFGDSL